MRRLIMFLFGLLLLALTVVMLFLTSAIYDTWSKESFNPYFFQTNELSVMRPGQPIRASEISESAMREMLIKKYVTEYFYAIPSVDNITMRKKSSSTLALLSTSDVFNAWVNGEAASIQAMATNQMMRTVAIDGEIHKPTDSDYWIVPYVLKTWPASNDMSVQPQINRGMLLLNIRYESGTREETLDIGNILKHSYNRFEMGYDPAVIFKFKVTDLERINND